MVKKFILSLLLFGNLYSSDLPSNQEVISSRHPLTIELYVAYCKYSSLQQYPDTKLLRLAGNDILLSSPWLHEKGFIELLQKSKNEDDLIKNIESNHNYSKAPKICQAYLKNNLLLAFKNLQ